MLLCAARRFTCYMSHVHLSWKTPEHADYAFSHRHTCNALKSVYVGLACELIHRSAEVSCTYPATLSKAAMLLWRAVFKLCDKLLWCVGDQSLATLSEGCMMAAWAT